MKVNPYNCNAYVTCLGSLAFEQFCQEGLFFDENKQLCDYEANVNCDPTVQAPEPIDPSNPEIQPHPECIAAGPGSQLLLPHETDCNKFYICNGNYAVTMTCPENLHFNKVLKLCDFEQTAGCTNF